MDFIKPYETEDTKGYIHISPLFERVNKDAVSKGGKLNAYWNGERWVSVEIDDKQLMIDIDKQMYEYRQEKYPHNDRALLNSVSLIPSVSKEYDRFFKNYKGNSHLKFNQHIFFKSDKPVREDYSTTQLAYDPVPGDTPTFDKIMGKWYSDADIEILLWFIGATLTNNIANVQKFIFIYGSGGSGKGSFLKIVEQIFGDYAQTISLKKMASNSQFANSEVKEIPVLIDPETDLSRIDNKENFLALTAHEELWVEKKGKDAYPVTFSGLLITASNKPYDMGNVKSGLGRRLVAVYPTGEKFATDEYYNLMDQVKFETAYIAQRAIDVFNSMGIEYINGLQEDYRMRMETDDMFNFIRENVRFGQLKDVATLKSASEAYRAYLESNDWSTKNYKNRIKAELKDYYQEYYEEKTIDGRRLYNVYIGLKMDKIFPEDYGDNQRVQKKQTPNPYSSDYNIFAESDFIAQYAKEDGTPKGRWKNAHTPIKELDQSKLHFVQLPSNRIRIDFDFDTLEENIEAAKSYPPTYGEISKSGKGIHLHYIYDGDTSLLDTQKHDNIEVKVSKGDSSVRRKFTKSNGKELAHISGGLPLKEEKKVDAGLKDFIATENTMRKEIIKSLKKEHHGATKPEIDFIYKILTDAKDQGITYDLRDMQQDVLMFALSSTHQSDAAIKVYQKMPFSTTMGVTNEPDKPTSKISIDDGTEAFRQIKKSGYSRVPDEELYFFDVEVFKNLLMVSWKKWGSPDATTWYNPTQEQIEWILDKPLVGFNNLRYDNHIMYAALIGKSPLDIYEVSHRIINDSKNSKFSAAYALAYTDIYDFSNTKQSLKKWEIELNLPHDELEFDWDAPLPEDDWERAAEYNRNDVYATEAVFKHLYADYEARLLLAEITDMPAYTTTNNLSAHFIFGDDPHPETKFNYTKLGDELFPGYKFGWKEVVTKKRDTGEEIKKRKLVSEYRGEDPSEGGYVYSAPGVYEDAVELDIRSMHPNSLINLEYFGPYTQRYKEIVDARALIKHAKNKDGSLNRENIDAAKEMLGGALAPYLTDDADFKGLAHALKIVVNAVYGMTSAKFPNKFKHPDNVDNIVAKRGALMMIDLRHAVEEDAKGPDGQTYTVIHIKTDSIKVTPNDDYIKEFIAKFAGGFGYEIEVAGEYDRMALVNKAVLIAHYKGGDEQAWHAIGTEFALPYTYKTLFTHEDINDADYIVAKSASKGPLYLGDKFIGKVGNFYASVSGEELTWENSAGKRLAPAGTKGFLWRKGEDLSSKFDLDMNYYDTIVVNALKHIQAVGDINKLLEVPDIYKGLLEL